MTYRLEVTTECRTPRRDPGPMTDDEIIAAGAGTVEQQAEFQASLEQYHGDWVAAWAAHQRGENGVD